MSTSCTSAALAATTSGSSGLARNTTGGTCAASLYASIDLHSGKRRLQHRVMDLVSFLKKVIFVSILSFDCNYKNLASDDLIWRAKHLNLESFEFGIDDADLRSGEEVSCEEDKTIEENKESPSQQSCPMMTPALHRGMSQLPISMMSAMTAAASSSSSSSTSRRNKRKNFQPRNIRPNEEDQDNDSPNSRETTNNPVAAADGSDDGAGGELGIPSDGPPAACCSISESKITTISSGRRERRKSSCRGNSNKKSTDAYSSSGCDVADESNHVAGTESRSRVTSDDDECRNSSRGSSSSRSSRSSHSHNGLVRRNSSSSQASSRNRSNTAVDLRLRPAFNTEEEEEQDEEEEDEEDNQMSDVSGLEMKTWMLFWQQQQSCNSNDGKPSFLLPPSVSHRQRPSDQQADSAASESHHAGSGRREVSSNYAETTMRELLGIYGLQRGAPAPVDSLPSGELIFEFLRFFGRENQIDKI